MTELMTAAEQTGRFHETRYADERTRILADEWRELTCMLPLNVAHHFGLNTHEDQVAYFSTPADRVAAYRAMDDPRNYLGPVLARLNGEAGLERVHAVERASQLFGMVFGRQVDSMRHNWQQGYFPRVRPIRIDGSLYDIYNHQPAFRFTGEVIEGPQFNWRTQRYDPTLLAEFDMSPLKDETGDYVPHDPSLPVMILPSMAMEPNVDRRLVVAHLQALHDSLSPDVVQAFAGGLPRVLEEERLDAERRPARSWRSSTMAQLAIARMF
jgi:hypothetical protein